MSSKPSVTVENLEDLINKLHKIFNATNNINIEDVEALLKAYKSNSKDWERFAKFDPHRYTRNLVDEGNGKFNLMALCWGEQNGSSIHDHSDSHCFVKVLQGSLMETRFDWPSDSSDNNHMQAKKQSVYKVDEVTYMNDSLGLHRMENPSHTDKTVSLHLYCPPFDSCKVFDERTGHSNNIKVTFWSRFGVKDTYVPGVNGRVPRRESSAAWNEDTIRSLPSLSALQISGPRVDRRNSSASWNEEDSVNSLAENN